MDDRHQQAAIRVLSEQRESRNLKAGHMRRQFGSRMPKAMTAEVEQMEIEAEALTQTIDLIKALDAADD